MIDPAALKTYILNDAELAALAGDVGDGSYPNSRDETIAQTANARMVAASKKVPVQDAYLYLLKRLKWRGIKSAAADANHPATDAAFTAVELILAPNMTIDFLDPVSTSLLGALVTTGLIDAADRDAIQAMSTTQVSEPEKLFGQRLHNLDVARAFGRVGFGG